MGLGWRLLAPPLACAVAVLALLAADGDTSGATLVKLAAGLALLIVVTAVTIQRRLIQPLARLGRETSGDATTEIPLPEEIARWDKEIRRLDGELAQTRTELASARDECRQTFAALQRSEERFAITVRSAHDGLWEWDLQSGAVLFSPRWKAMLGYADDEFPNQRDAWLAQVHPDDAPRVEAELGRHLTGEQSQCECQLRIRHKDGRYRWLLSRAAALRHASGKPYRIVGLDTDITRVKRVESIVEQIAEGTAGAHGEVFFRALVRHFAGALDVACAFVTECVDRPATRVRTLAYWKSPDFRDNIEFELAGTPCEAVVREGRTCHHRAGVGQAFPRDAAYEGYVGVPIFGSEGSVIGHLAFFDTREIGEELLVEPIFRIFTARAAAELERRNAVERLARQFTTAA